MSNRMMLGALIVGATLWTQLAESAGNQADTLFRNGNFYTPSGWVSDVAVKDGVILGIGSAQDVGSFVTADTEVVDLRGATVLPGLHDMHVHPLGAGMQQYQCRFAQGSTPDQIFAHIASCVAAKKPGEWISGGQWEATAFGDTPPHRSMLDKVASDNPVVLSDISGHSVWANSLALKLAGIDDATPDPDGGVIERDQKGVATGILRETAGALVRGKLPGYTPEQNVGALAWSMNEMLRHGVTSFSDAGVNEATMRAYAALADSGRLKQRVRGCVMWRPVVFNAADADLDEPLKVANLYTRERFKPDCVKVVLDGVPTDGHTAAMVEDYADAHSHGDERAKGILMVPQAELDKAVTELDARGLAVKFHAAGDAAVRAALDAIEAARKANGFSGVLHDPGHNSFVQLSDIKRARALGATFEMSPYIWYPNPIIPDIAKAIGEQRMQRWIPVKDALDAGALVVPGSDWNVVPSVNPWIAIETLVTRQAPGAKGEVLGASQKITLEQAVEMFTESSALHMGHREEVGSIEPGMRADFAVIDRNPFDIPPGQIHQTKVLMTIIDGEVVYRAR